MENPTSGLSSPSWRGFKSQVGAGKSVGVSAGRCEVGEDVCREEPEGKLRQGSVVLLMVGVGLLSLEIFSDLNDSLI